MQRIFRKVLCFFVVFCEKFEKILDLTIMDRFTTLTVQQKDKYGNEVQNPSAVVWTVTNNGSNAVITGNTLNTGNKRGTVTLTASVGPEIKSSSTIFVGTNVTAVSAGAATMSSSAGNNTISLSGDFLGHD